MQSGKVVFISDLISNSNKYASQFVRVVGYVRDIDFQSLKFVLEDDRHRLLVDSRLLDLASLRPGDLIQIWGDFNVNMDGDKNVLGKIFRITNDLDLNLFKQAVGEVRIYMKEN